jgi:GYF domain 2
MATYLIIGGDGKQYGPVTDAELRQWIAEGRLAPSSEAKAESDAEFRPLSTFPEFAEAFGLNTPATIAPLPRSGADLLQGDYDLDVGKCISNGWMLVKNNFWPVIGATTLVILATGLINQIFGLIMRPAINNMVNQKQINGSDIAVITLCIMASAPLYTVLNAGLFRYLLKLIRGEDARISDAFSGFGPAFGQLALLSVAQMILLILGCALCLIPGIYLSVAWCFAVPLVIDKKMGFWQAMEFSRKMVTKHWFIIFGFLVVYGLLAMSGIVACFIGIFVTMPIGLAALMIAYETIFSDAQN